MLKYLVLLFLFFSIVFSQTTPDLQNCEGVFTFTEPFDLGGGELREALPQLRQIQVIGLVEVLAILDPKNTFQPLSLMGGQMPETYDSTSEVTITCQDDYLFFRLNFNSPEEKQIIYSLPDRTFTESLFTGYVFTAMKMSEHIYALETGDGSWRSVINFIDMRDGSVMTDTGDELLEDGSNEFSLGSTQTRALALYEHRKLLVLESVESVSDANDNTAGISRITLGLYEIVDDSFKVNKLGECSFEHPNEAGDYRFTFTNNELTFYEPIYGEKYNNSQSLPECQHLADLMKE
jgi:hypothetical protein